MMLRRGLRARWGDRRKTQRRGLRGFESVTLFFLIARLRFSHSFLEGLASVIVQHGLSSMILRPLPHEAVKLAYSSSS